MSRNFETITLAGGCFWCTEAVFQRLNGVLTVTPGYAGGSVKNPSYEKVSSGLTGHAESVQIKYDPKKISLREILDVFWDVHDPTSVNRQGNDIGSQYRSVIFYHNSKQKDVARKSIRDLKNSGVYKNNIVTEVKPFKSFYKAEEYHKNYYGKNPNNLYCTYVIKPKLHKLNKKYNDMVKKEYL